MTYSVTKYIYFFFSSRRRHTRWPRDWSSDVCSSDLVRALLAQVPGNARAAQHHAGHAPLVGQLRSDHADADGTLLPDTVVGQQGLVLVDATREFVGEVFRSEERRVGKECRSRGAA